MTMQEAGHTPLQVTEAAAAVPQDPPANVPDDGVPYGTLRSMTGLLIGYACDSQRYLAALRQR